MVKNSHKKSPKLPKKVSSRRAKKQFKGKEKKQQKAKISKKKDDKNFLDIKAFFLGSQAKDLNI